jgi:hypothetical protein
MFAFCLRYKNKRMHETFQKIFFKTKLKMYKEKDKIVRIEKILLKSTKWIVFYDLFYLIFW